MRATRLLGALILVLAIAPAARAGDILITDGPPPAGPPGVVALIDTGINP
jgi:hypothetical protein